jgi:hypothetical protein
MSLAAGGGIVDAAEARSADPCRPRPMLQVFAVVHAAQSDMDSAQDRAALVALYNAAGGDDWIDSTNWLSNEPLDAWYGVETENGRVVYIDLCGPGGNNLRGSIPPAVGDLTALRDLRLSNNFLTGRIPSELGGLAELEVLRLSNNALSGPVPSALGDLAKLEELRLHQNRLTGDLPSSVSRLANLRRLRIEDNAGLCAPADADFRAWLLTLDEFRGDCAVAVPVLPLPAILGLALLLLGSGWWRSRRHGGRP